MYTALFILLVVVAVIAYKIRQFALIARSKLTNAALWVRMAALEAALSGLQEKQADPQYQSEEISDLIARMEPALVTAKEAYEKGDLEALSAIADPLLQEVKQLAEKYAAEKAAATEIVETVETQVEVPVSPVVEGAPKDQG